MVAVQQCAEIRRTRAFSRCGGARWLMSLAMRAARRSSMTTCPRSSPWINRPRAPEWDARPW